MLARREMTVNSKKGLNKFMEARYIHIQGTVITPNLPNAIAVPRPVARILVG
jgi:hypothetical protein